MIAEHGVEYARRVMQENDDFGFIRGHLTSEAATELNLFRFKGPARGPYQVQEADIDSLAQKYIGQSPYPWRSPGEQRVSFLVEPTHVFGMGD